MSHFHALTGKFSSRVRIGLWTVLLAAVVFGFTAVVAVGAPVVIATKTDQLLSDADSSGGLTPGDTIRYTVTINNTGSDPASGVSFNDTIDSGTTLSGVIHVSPIAIDDSYSSLGNVGITVPAANGVLANDVDPDSNVSLSAVAAAGATTQGGAFALASDGSFSYTPPAGFEGTDTFTYGLSDGDTLTPNATGTVRITVNEVIWFVNNSQGSQGNGTLNSPFNSLDGAGGYNAAAPDEAGDIVFLYSGSGNYSGGIALLNNQILIGQGASASIATIAGITVPPFGNPLPSTGGTRPTITSTAAGVTLAQNNTLRGFNVGNTTARGITDNGGTAGNLTVSEVADTGTGTGIEVNNGGALNVTLISVSASGGVNGIDLRNTSGSFSVTGTGTADSGGTLSGHTAEGVYLNNSLNISLTDMVIDEAATTNTQGIDATSVTGLTLIRTTITAGGGNSYALLGSTLRNLTATNSIFDGGDGTAVANIDGVKITNLLGTNTLTGVTVRDGKNINMLVDNSTNGGGLDTLTISGATFSKGIAGDHLQIRTSGTANLKVVVQNNGGTSSSFSGATTDSISFQANGGTLQGIVTGSTFTGNLGNVVNMSAANTGRLTARVHNLSNLTSANSNVINTIAFDTATIEATVENNVITSHPQGAGIRFILEGNGTVKAKASNNTISGATQSWGILAQPRAGNGRMDLTLNNNNVTNTALDPINNTDLDGIEVTSGSSAGTDTNVLCLNMFSNTSSSETYDGFFIRHRNNTTFFLQDFPSGTAANWVTNTKSNSGSVATSGTFTNASSACATPTVPTASVSNNSVVDSGLYRASVAEIAPLSVTNTAPAVVWDTNDNLVIDRKNAVHGRRTAVPALAGETINLNIGTLPAGKSVTIVFDVTVNSISQVSDLKAQVCNQGTVSGTGFSNVLTDDPDVGGSSDPTCTAFQSGTIHIVKDASPNSTSTFGFASPGLSPTSFTLDDNGNNGDTYANTQTFTAAPGQYAVSENNPSATGYTLTGLACDDDASDVASGENTGARTATINLEPNETLTCTFTNTASPEPDNYPTNLTATADSHTQITTAWTDSTGTNLPGSYLVLCSLTNTFTDPQDGSPQSNDTHCADGSGVQNVAHGSGGSIAWTGLAPSQTYYFKIFPYSNSGAAIEYKTDGTPPTANATTLQAGKLEVVKHLLPTSNGGRFDLQIDGNSIVTNVGNNGTTGEVTVAVGNHTVGEVGNGGTTLSSFASSIECRDNNGAGSVVASGSGSSLSNVPVNANDDIVCIITNRLKGIIAFQKAVTQGDPNHPNQVFNISINLNGSVVAGNPNVQPGAAPTGQGGLELGTVYTVNENNIPAGWRLDNISCVDNAANSTFGTFAAGDTSIEVTLDTGADVVCTFTNSFDITPPTITAPSNVTLEAPANTSPANTGTATASDDRDPSPTISFSDATTPGNCAGNFSIARTWKATDSAGNAATAVQTITSQDTTAPTLTLPADIEINAGDSTDPSNTGTATATDAGSPPATVTFSDSQVDNVITRTWTATDGCGNQRSGDQTITILSNVDLEITISESVDPVVAGSDTGSGNGIDNLVHTITVKNNGPATATNIVVQFGANTNPAPTLAFQDGNQHPTIGNQWQIPSLASGQSGTMTLTWDVGAGYSGANSISSDATLLAVDQTETDNSNDSASESTTVTRDVDLALTKSDNGAAPTTGDLISYELTATNNGVSHADGVIFSETVPANTTFDAAGSATGWSCSDGAAAGTTCTLDFASVQGRISANGGSGRVTFAVRVNATLPAGVDAIRNSASVSDPDETNADDNDAVVDTPVNAEPDLRLTKDDGGQEALPGETIVYQLTVANNGNQGATGVVLTETVPDKTVFNAGASTAGWNCTPDDTAGSTCTLSVGSVSAGAEAQTFDFAVDVLNPFPGQAGDEISNSASVTDDGANGPSPSTDSASDSTRVSQRIYLSLSGRVTVDGITFENEDIAVYNPVTDSWAMHFDGSDVGMTEDIDGFTILEDGSILISYDDAEDVPGISGRVDDSDIVRFVPTSLGQSTAGTFEFFFDGSDVGLATGDEDIVAIAVDPDGRLVISTDDDFDVPGVSGDDEDLLVFNAVSFGADTAGAWDLYFDGSDVSLASEDIGGAWINRFTNTILLTVDTSFSVPGSSGANEDIFAFQPASLGANTAGTYGPGLYWDGSQHGWADEQVDGLDLGGGKLPGDSIEPMADLDLEKRDAVDPVQVGSDVVYTVRVRNDGPATASGIVMTDTLPAGVAFVEATGPGASCGESGGVVTCTVDDLAQGEQVDITVTVNAGSVGELENQAGVTAATFDPNTSNNTDRETTNVTIDPPPPAGRRITVSSSSGGSVDGVSFNDEDILVYNPADDSWAMLFDGSDVGISADVNAFHLMDDGSILLSFNDPATLSGLGQVEDSDIVRFVPTRLGPTTAGAFELYFDGSDVGLSAGGEDIDAIGLTADGRLVISTLGSVGVPGLSAKDEDLLLFNATSLGANTSGTWELYFDGSDEGLTDGDEDIMGAWIDPVTGEIYLTTKDDFNAGGVTGEKDDIFICAPAALGENTACAFSFFWDGDAHSFGRERVDGLALGDLPPAFDASAAAQADLNGLPAADGLNDDIADDVDTDADDDLPEDWTGDDDPDDGTGPDTSTGWQLFLPVVGR